MKQSGNHRADIDGLRAFAVLLVVIFHINETLVPGGFVGVDMFFVISGFLITGNIVRDRGAGQFSYAEFYRRRIKRIFPAMFLVTGATLLAGLALLLPEDMETLSWSAIATALSGANVFFTWWLDTSYFAADSRTIPLLHMWSLGVEEQFYLVWPTLILALLPFRRAVIPVLLILIVASIAFGQWLLDRDQVGFAYYMLPPRLFQLAVGGVLVFLLANPLVGRFLDHAAILAFALGAAMVGWSVATLTGETPFPGFNALPVTGGTALLLAAGTRINRLSAAISVQPLRHIGEISYSLYLWHWPVLAFQRYFYDELSPTRQLVSFAVMLALSQLSYRLVETPLRHTRQPFRLVFLKQFAAPVVVVAVTVVGIIATEGYGPWLVTSYPMTLAATPTVEPAASSKTVCQRSTLNASILKRSDCVDGTGAATALLYGDSNAAHYIGFAGSLARLAGVTLRNFEHSACPPILGDPTPFVAQQYLTSCKKSLAAVRDLLPHYKTIFVGASWPEYDATGRRNGVSFEIEVRNFVSFLTEQDVQVVLLTKLPIQKNFDHRCEQKAVKAWWLDCADAGLSPRLAIPFNSVLEEIAKENPLVRVLDPSDQVCTQKECRAFSVSNRPLYFDKGHLNYSGSWTLGRQYARSPSGRALQRFLASSSGAVATARAERDRLYPKYYAKRAAHEKIAEQLEDKRAEASAATADKKALLESDIEGLETQLARAYAEFRPLYRQIRSLNRQIADKR